MTCKYIFFSNYKDEILGPKNTVAQLIFNFTHFMQRILEIVIHFDGIILWHMSLWNNFIEVFVFFLRPFRFYDP
jgi:hypothetical protein